MQRAAVDPDVLTQALEPVWCSGISKMTNHGDSLHKIFGNHLCKFRAAPDIVAWLAGSLKNTALACAVSGKFLPICCGNLPLYPASRRVRQSPALFPQASRDAQPRWRPSPASGQSQSLG